MTGAQVAAEVAVLVQVTPPGTGPGAIEYRKSLQFDALPVVGDRITVTTHVGDTVMGMRGMELTAVGPEGSRT